MVFGCLRPTRSGGRGVAKERTKQPLECLMAMIPNTNSQEGHRVTRRVPNSHEGTEWLGVCPEGRQMFCAWFPSFVFFAVECQVWPFYAILSHLMPFLAISFQFLPPGVAKMFYARKKPTLFSTSCNLPQPTYNPEFLSGIAAPVMLAKRLPNILHLKFKQQS